MTLGTAHHPDVTVPLDTIDAAVDALRRGLPVLVADDADREDEGDVVLAASLATDRWIAWTIRHSSGVLCAPLPADLADRLGLPPMVAVNEDARGTAYTVSVDARVGVGTGISAADRARTARVLADPDATAGDLVRPGHLFPLRARDGGVRERPGHTEAAVDLCRLAGLPPVGVISEVAEDDGTMTRLPGLRRLADRFGLPLVTIADLAEHLRRREEAGEGLPGAGATGTAAPGAAVLAAVPGPDPRPEVLSGPAAGLTGPRVVLTTRAELPTRHGAFTVHGVRDLLTGRSHLALVAGRPADGALVRVHSECLTGDVLGSLRCDCGPQLDESLRLVADSGGVVVYLRGHEGRGIGLLPKIAAYRLQDAGADTVAGNTRQGLPADAREYGAAAAVLQELGLHRVRLLTNNPAKSADLAAHGVEVVQRVPLRVGATPENLAYLRSKRDLFGHALDPDAPDPARPGPRAAAAGGAAAGGGAR